MASFLDPAAAPKLMAFAAKSEFGRQRASLAIRDCASGVAVPGVVGPQWGFHTAAHGCAAMVENSQCRESFRRIRPESEADLQQRLTEVVSACREAYCESLDGLAFCQQPGASVTFDDLARFFQAVLASDHGFPRDHAVIRRAAIWLATVGWPAIDAPDGVLEVRLRNDTLEIENRSGDFRRLKYDPLTDTDAVFRFVDKVLQALPEGTAVALEAPHGETEFTTMGIVADGLLFDRRSSVFWTTEHPPFDDGASD